MPKRAHSIDRTRVRFSTAARALDECAIPGRPWWGESVTFSTLPPRPPGIIAFVATVWVISHVPRTLSRWTVSKPFGVMSSAGVMYCPPALFTSVSIRPCSARTRSTNDVTWSSSRMSHANPLQRPPSHSAAVSSSGSWRRPATTTVAPHAASSTAVARPSPDPPPVTTTTWPSRSPWAKTCEGMRAGRLSCAPMATAAEPQPAVLPLPGGKRDATVKLHPLLSGTAKGPPAWIHREEGRLAKPHALGIGVSKSDYLEIPIVAFLVEHPSAGAILIDTGLHPSCAIDPKQNLGRVGAIAFPGLQMDAKQAVVNQLRARGIQPSAVNVVVMTHLHIDHASAMSEFPNATFVFSKREWEAAGEPRNWQHGYRTRQFDHGFDYRTIDFEEGDAVTSSYATFGRSVDLLG